MTKEELLNENTQEVLSKSESKQQYTIGYVILSLVVIMCLVINSCVKSAELKALKNKQHNDSLAIKSLKSNLLMPQVINNSKLE